MATNTVKVGKDGIPYFDHDTEAKLDYSYDWSAFIADVGQAIASVSWSATPTGLNIVSTIVSGTVATVIVQTSAGNAGTTFTLRSKVFTADYQDADGYKIKVASKPIGIT